MLDNYSPLLSSPLLSSPLLSSLFLNFQTDHKQHVACEIKVVGFVKQHVACEIMVSFMCRTGNVREPKTTFSYVLQRVEFINIHSHGNTVMSSNDSISMVLKCMLKGAADFEFKLHSRILFFELIHRVTLPNCFCFFGSQFFSKSSKN